MVRDLLGREIKLSQPAKRVVLGQGRFLSMMGMVHPDPLGVLVGWANDLSVAFPDEAAAWFKRHPILKTLPVIGQRSGSDYALEKILMLNPDLVLVSRFAAGLADRSGSSASIEGLTSAGLNVAVIDFAQDPLKDTVPSLKILASLLGQEQLGDETSSFYLNERERITAPFVAKASAPKSLLIHSHAGLMPCCASIGRGSFADLAGLVGGQSIASDVLQKAVGPLNLEFVLTKQPSYYVATGGTRGQKSGGIAIGADIDAVTARATLANVISDPGLEQLSAIKQRRVHALWHGLNETPLHLVALEALANWLNPDLKGQFNEERMLAAFRKRYPILPQEGVYSVSLDA